MEFVYQTSHFDIQIETNHTFEAENQDHALEIAEKHEHISDYFELYYDHLIKDFVISITRNGYFDDVFISNYRFYDESKGDYLHLDIGNGQTIYPVLNPDCFEELNKDLFIQQLQSHFEGYLQEKDIITFDSISYGVKEANVDTLILG
ncbi:hypothetical protein [Cytobacillus pseudoceanisediminis]